MTDTVVIAGAGAPHGVGGAIGRRFAKEGFHVVVSGRTLDKVAASAEVTSTAMASAEPPAATISSAEAATLSSVRPETST